MDDQAQATRTLRNLLAQIGTQLQSPQNITTITEADSVVNQKDMSNRNIGPSYGYSQQTRQNVTVDPTSEGDNFQTKYMLGQNPTTGFFLNNSNLDGDNNQQNAAALHLLSTSPSAKPFNIVNDSLLSESLRIRRTRSVIPNRVKDEIWKLADDNPRITQGEIAQMFGIDRTTVSKILKRKKQFTDDGNSPVSKMSRPEGQVSLQLEEALFSWYVQMKELNIMVTQPMLLETAESMANRFGVVGFTFDKRWLSAFLEKHMDKVKTITRNIQIIIPIMAGGWTGFSDEDLRRLKTQDGRRAPPRDAPTSTVKTAKFQKSRSVDAERRTVSSAAGAPPSPSSSLSPGQRLAMPKPTSQPIPNRYTSTGNRIPRDRCQIGVVSESSISSSESEVTAALNTDETGVSEAVRIKKEPKDLELNEEEALSRELGSLEKFREQQKHIEEANKQKKALLAKTLSERQKKARQEAQKLTHIQKELTILDNLLSADVTVIRDKIEIASREFLEAQKRYERAEKEFVEAKLDLQKKSELKEQMTEHLYTIIHQNEVRKAKKLAELMKELEMEANEENIHMGTLPPLSSFNTVNTIHTLNSPKSSFVTTPYKSQSPASPKSKDVSGVSDSSNQTNDKNQTFFNNVLSQMSDKQPISNNSVEISQPRTEECTNSSETECISSQVPASSEVSSQSNVISESECPSSTVVIGSDDTPSVVTENLESDNNIEGSSDNNQNPVPTSDHVQTSSDLENQNTEIPSTWTLNLVDVKHEPKVDNS